MQPCAGKPKIKGRRPTRAETTVTPTPVKAASILRAGICTTGALNDAV